MQYDGIYKILNDYYYNNKSDNVLNINQIVIDGKEQYLKHIFERSNPHDKDYIIFERFKDPNTIILDIGANYGISIASFRAVGVKSKIISFEPIPLYMTFFEAIKKRDNSFEYFSTGLYNKESRNLKFVIPVLNGEGLTSLTSASKEPNTDLLAKHVIRFNETWRENREITSFNICEFFADTLPLDLLIDENQEHFLHSIVGIKIDVEGLEFEVLQGAINTINKHKPLIMIEGANRDANIANLMKEMGYIFCTNIDGELRHTEKVVSDVNGFFLHP
jgi:FkbM family methyltransferase